VMPDYVRGKALTLDMHAPKTGGAEGEGVSLSIFYQRIEEVREKAGDHVIMGNGRKRS